MTHIRKSIFLAFAALLAAVLLASPIGKAQAPCDQLVVDEANVFKNDIGRVEAAARELVNSGADVRVRTMSCRSVN